MLIKSYIPLFLITNALRDQDKSFIQKLFAVEPVEYLRLICKIELTLAKFRNIWKSVRGESGFETSVSEWKIKELDTNKTY